jgi:hypothetical protein
MHVAKVVLSEIEVLRHRFQGYKLHTADLSVAVLADRLKPDGELDLCRKHIVQALFIPHSISASIDARA